MAQDHPELQDTTAKVLKHSKSTERRYYDFDQAPKQAVQVRTLMPGKIAQPAATALPSDGSRVKRARLHHLQTERLVSHLKGNTGFYAGVSFWNRQLQL